MPDATVSAYLSARRATTALLTPCARADHNTPMAVARITKDDLKQKLDADDGASKPVLVDVRLKYPFEHSTVKLPGAVRLAPGSPGAAAGLPKGQDLVLYCSDPDEITSSQVAAGLIREGFKAKVLKGGIAEWMAASFPTEPRDPAHQTPVEPATPKA